MGIPDEYLEDGRSDLCPQGMTENTLLLTSAQENVNNDIFCTLGDPDRLDLIPGANEAINELCDKLKGLGIPENIIKKMVKLFENSYLLNPKDFDILIKGIITYKNNLDDDSGVSEMNWETAYDKALNDINNL